MYGHQNEYHRMAREAKLLFWVVAGIVCIAAIGVIDYLTGYEIAFSLFYLFPIALLTWYAGHARWNCGLCRQRT